MKYKVGDRVKMRSLQWCKENIFNNEDKYPPELFRGIEKFCGKILTISDAVDKSKYVDEGYYNMDEDTEWDYYWTDEMIEGLAEEEDDFEKMYMESEKRYEEEYSKGEYCHEQSFKWGFQEGYDYAHENEKLEINLKNGYEFKDDNGNVINTKKIILEKKKKEYPKTYEECCKVLGVNSENFLSIRNVHCYDGDEETIKYERELLNKFDCLWQLIICRDAYWKIAGEEIGLGKDLSWVPDWMSVDTLYVILYQYHDIYKAEVNGGTSCFLAFPTAEMRDAFKENFKELIEQCKELL